MTSDSPVDSIRATFVDELIADEVATALNAWFRWIVTGSEGAPPPVFEALGVDSADFAWTREDVDWSLGPHARVLGNEVRISLQTHETWRTISGLLRRLGALTVRVERED